MQERNEQISQLHRYYKRPFHSFIFSVYLFHSHLNSISLMRSCERFGKLYITIGFLAILHKNSIPICGCFFFSSTRTNEFPIEFKLKLAKWNWTPSKLGGLNQPQRLIYICARVYMCLFWLKNLTLYLKVDCYLFNRKLPQKRSKKPRVSKITCNSNFCFFLFSFD